MLARGAALKLKLSINLTINTWQNFDVSFYLLSSTQTQIVDKLDYKYIEELRFIFLSSYTMWNPIIRLHTIYTVMWLVQQEFFRTSKNFSETCRLGKILAQFFRKILSGKILGPKFNFSGPLKWDFGRKNKNCCRIFIFSAPLKWASGRYQINISIRW